MCSTTHKKGIESIIVDKKCAGPLGRHRCLPDLKEAHYFSRDVLFSCEVDNEAAQLLFV